MAYVKKKNCLISSFDLEIAFSDVKSAVHYYELECDCYDPMITFEGRFNYELNCCKSLDDVCEVLNKYESDLNDRGEVWSIESVVTNGRGVRIGG